MAMNIQLDKDVLLLRSITSILHVVHPQAVEGTVSHDGQTGLLNRLALLFVAGEPADVAAVTAAKGVGLELMALTPADNGMHNTILLSKNSPGSAQQEQSSEASNAQPREDWMLHCLQFGPLSAQAHAQQLQYLVRQLYGPDHTTAMTNLRRYIYFHCCPKVQKKLHTTFPGRSTQQFSELFREHPQLQWKAIHKYLSSKKKPPATSLPPPEVSASSEEWLAKSILQAHSSAATKLSKHLELDEDGHLGREPETVSLVCQRMQSALKIAEGKVETVMELRGGCLPRSTPQNDETGAKAKELIQPLCGALDQLDSALGVLSHLAHHSAIFWHLLALDPFRDARPPVVLESATPIVLDDADEEHDGTYPPHNDLALFRDWFKSLSQWPRAIISLDTDGDIVRFITTRDLEIKAIPVPTPPCANQQASLEATLSSFCDKAEDVVTARKWLRDAGEKRSHPLARILAGDNDESWSTSFRGTVHCECALACMVSGKPHLKKIGVSKRCCFACFKFLEKIDAFDTPPTHGKVYAWTPPNEATAEVKAYVLSELQAVLKAAIDSGRRRTDSHAGSDAGHPEGDKPPTGKKLEEEDLGAEFEDLFQD
ncbi:hypothetical protein FRB96_005781 [Tulasnella sp. 330]|nr:hypothetical protein FRB96_005781 [Tulasnella sp. 330]